MEKRQATDPWTKENTAMRSRTFKAIAAAVGAVTLVVPMAACGSSSAGDSSTNKLTIYSYYNRATMDPVVAAFKKGAIAVFVGGCLPVRR